MTHHSQLCPCSNYWVENWELLLLASVFDCVKFTISERSNMFICIMPNALNMLWDTIQHEFVYLIQHGRLNYLWNSLVLWIFWRWSDFENTSYITREKQSYSLCKSTKICIAYADAFTLMISFVFSSWIINEFHNEFFNNCETNY